MRNDEYLNKGIELGVLYLWYESFKLLEFLLESLEILLDISRKALNTYGVGLLCYNVKNDSYHRYNIAVKLHHLDPLLKSLNSSLFT